MTIYTLDDSQRKAARIAGFLYLLLMATGVFAEMYGRGSLIVDGDMAKTVGNIIAHERLFRLGIACNIFTFAGDIALTVALYVLLRPVNKILALVAALWRVVESAILGVITLNGLVALMLLTDVKYAKAFSTIQWQTLASLFNDAHDAGYTIGLIFLALGCTVFSYLFFKSRYIPRLLAAFGIFAYVLMLAASFAIIVFPDIPISGSVYMPAGLFEITIGLWLLFRGARAPVSA